MYIALGFQYVDKKKLLPCFVSSYGALYGNADHRLRSAQRHVIEKYCYSKLFHIDTVLLCTMCKSNIFLGIKIGLLISLLQ